MQWTSDGMLSSPYAQMRRRRLHSAKEVAKLALRLFARTSIATTVLLALQLAYVAVITPRLPPPPLSGVDFVRDGRVVTTKKRIVKDVEDDEVDDDDICEEKNVFDVEGGEDDEWDDISYKTYITTQNTDDVKKKDGQNNEFRLFLVGDSPVEGIGNTRHKDALGGQTARAFAIQFHSLQGELFDHCRYWSYGKSGLTARGIEEDMVPYLRRVVSGIVHHRQTLSERSSRYMVEQPVFHAVVLLCGVNNVLDPRSTPESFRLEVCSLLASIRNINEMEGVPLIVLGLPDFATLPFLPWPLGIALGWRGRKMQKMLESAVNELRCRESVIGVDTTVMVNIPDVAKIIGSIGYNRHDSECDGMVKGGTTNADPLKMRWCHPLKDNFGTNAINRLNQGSLTISDFLCDDGFHPGKYGTMYIGSLIASSYMRSLSTNK